MTYRQSWFCARLTEMSMAVGVAATGLWFRANVLLLPNCRLGSKLPGLLVVLTGYAEPSPSADRRASRFWPVTGCAAACAALPSSTSTGDRMSVGPAIPLASPLDTRAVTGAEISEAARRNAKADSGADTCRVNELEFADRWFDPGESAGDGLCGDNAGRKAGDMRLRAGETVIGDDDEGRVTRSSSCAMHVDSEVKPRLLPKSVSVLRQTALTQDRPWSSHYQHAEPLSATSTGRCR